MMLKVYDFFKSLLWYVVDFIFSLIDTLIEIIRELNAIDIINSLADNIIFQKLYKGIIVIAVTLFALFIIWKFINKIIDPDDETTIKTIVFESVKCGLLIILSTFVFSQVSNFSITLSNYTGNIFESTTNSSMANNMLGMFISYNEDYKKSEEFNEKESITELVNSGDFKRKEMYLDKYVTDDDLFFDDKDYKYSINWIMAILCGGFFLYSLFFAGIMLGRRQVEFLFLFAISPIVFSTSICNKQRRGAVIEQLVSLVLQSSVVMLIVNLSVLIMQQISITTFFTNGFQDLVIKVLLYLGCATFILTGSQTINRFIGANVSAASGREQLMSMMGFGKMATIGGLATGGALLGGGLLATGGAMKAGRFAKNSALTSVGLALSNFGTGSSGNPTRMQKVANTLGTKMFNAGQTGFSKNKNKSSKISDAFVNVGANSIGSAIRTVIPRASYNPSYYRRRKNMI